MAKIRWTSEAEKWLREIYDYIAQDNGNAAQRVITGIYKKVQILKDFPEIRSKELIDILGVFHGAMEIERYLKILA